MENIDQTPAAGVEVESQMTSELDDLFQIDPFTDAPDSEEVNSEDTEDNQIAEHESIDQPEEDDESQAEEELDEEESDDEEVDEDGEDIDPDTITMTVAGQEVKGLKNIIAKANSINGANTQLAGDVKRYRSESESKDTTIASLTERIKKWEAYFDGQSTDEPEKYEAPPEKKEEAKQLDPETHARYIAEFQEVQSDEHYAQTLPMMKTILEDMGGNAGLSPKEIYAIAKERLGIKPTQPKKPIKKTTVKRAKKVLGGSNRRVTPTNKSMDLPPELGDLL